MKKGLFYLVSSEHKDKIDVCSTLSQQALFEIIHRLIPYKSDKDGYISMSGKELQTISRNYKQYIDYLVKNKIIFVDNNYSVKDAICRRYKLREEKISTPLKVEITDKRFLWLRINSINEKRKKMTLISKVECFRKMKVCFVNFINGLDFEKIFTEVCKIEDIGNRMLQASLMYNIQDNNIYFSRNKTNNRLDTNLTNLVGEYKYLHFNNDYAHIDIKNSQPFFLYLLLNNYTNYSTNSIPISTALYTPLLYNDMQIELNSYISQLFTEVFFDDFEEIKTYGNLVKNGQLYDYISAQKNMSRDDVKEMIMCIFFSKPNSYKEQKLIFNSLFPKIGEFIHKFKKEQGYEEMAIMLQRMESFNVLDNICRILVTNGIIPITIHDSWIVPLSQKEKAMEMIREYFGEDVPTLRIDTFEDEQKKLFPQYYS